MGHPRLVVHLRMILDQQGKLLLHEPVVRGQLTRRARTTTAFGQLIVQLRQLRNDTIPVHRSTSLGVVVHRTQNVLQTLLLRVQRKTENLTIKRLGAVHDLV